MTATQTVTRRATASAASAQKATTHQKQIYDRTPIQKPPFTVGDLRRAIPAHCFTRPLLKSFSYLFVDLALVALIYYASTFIPLAPASYQWALWVVYWCFQGCVMTGLWVIGHECGHGGFADADWINDVVGLVVHSCLLVPYHCWAISHRRHHSNTGSIEHDEVFVPAMADKQQQEIRKRKEDAGLNVYEHEDEGYINQTISTLNRLLFIVVMLTLGWPGYLISNMSGNKSYDPSAWVNHFMPSSPIFTNGLPSDKQQQKLVMISDVALLVVITVLLKLCMVTSFTYMFCVFFVPYLITNLFLVLITYLQHTDIALPHYTSNEWEWLRGALATVDRDYGILNVVFHHITDTHVTHHLFSSMPHYHAQEATDAIKPILGDYYRYDSTPIVKSLWRSFRDCQYVYPDQQHNGVHWF